MAVFDCSGCCYRVLQAGRLRPQKNVVSQFWRHAQEAKIKVWAVWFLLGLCVCVGGGGGSAPGFSGLLMICWLTFFALLCSPPVSALI